eukprot:CAMPEP_0174238042 /NCGR_PEP_ID=MMETSP0417-20130205/10139_1 /TAXON_ID=242541 /ORGANISM="Mayorella sp, Strain BSH-02190019" /LENGTH=771 /DNA_ID=CAMNT_0015316847 /DNA_START=94 /DNA_END=2409 /DNA_ORIENTATION=+
MNLCQSIEFETPEEATGYVDALVQQKQENGWTEARHTLSAYVSNPALLGSADDARVAAAGSAAGSAARATKEDMPNAWSASFSFSPDVASFASSSSLSSLSSLSSSPGVRRFVADSSSGGKFWEVHVDGVEVVVSYGALSAKAPRTQRKKLASQAAASAHAEKQIADKLKKGYREVTDSGKGKDKGKEAATEDADDLEVDFERLAKELAAAVECAAASQQCATKPIRRDGTPLRENNDDLGSSLPPTPFEEGDYGTGMCPLTLVELRMLQLSGAIRSKPDWTRKMADPVILRKWFHEALSLNDPPSPGVPPVTPRMVLYVLEELALFAQLKVGDLEMSSVFGVVVKQRLESDLASKVVALEDVPEHAKDWHPGSDQQVLDLVHPSLFPVVYGVTRALPRGHGLPWDEFLGAGEPIPKRETPKVAHPSWYTPHKFSSEKYQWLPTDFLVDANGDVRIVSYINNLHPKIHAPLYDTIAQVFGEFVPLFERMLTYNKIEYTRAEAGDWYDGDEFEAPDDDDGDAYEQWEENRVVIQPKPDLPFQMPSPPKLVSLRNRRLQVIVKLASIHLTPEKPTYDGGVWHVEGMQNENIVASGIYYYSIENLTESKLAFRVAVAEPNYEQHDERGVSAVYGLENERSLNQPRGSIVAEEGRCFVWPNHYQHRVLPFELKDKTRPGHRKFLVFFLCDPTKDIYSTEHVPPQQASWHHQSVLDTGVLSGLPSEMQLEVLKHSDFPMTLEKAKEIRVDLMHERKFVQEQTTEAYFEREFSLCEH